MFGRYFEGGIYGAQDDYKSFSKEILIRRMISRSNARATNARVRRRLRGNQERERRGGNAVGLATAEPECQVVDEWKRKRLVSVGADFIVPNFLCWKSIFRRASYFQSH